MENPYWIQRENKKNILFIMPSSYRIFHFVLTFLFPTMFINLRLIIISLSRESCATFTPALNPFIDNSLRARTETSLHSSLTTPFILVPRIKSMYMVICVLVRTFLLGAFKMILEKAKQFSLKNQKGFFR